MSTVIDIEAPLGLQLDAPSWTPPRLRSRFNEEPALRRRFGEPYERCLREVPGWWPRQPSQ